MDSESSCSGRDAMKKKAKKPVKAVKKPAKPKKVSAYKKLATKGGY